MNTNTTYIFTIPPEQILQRNCSGGVVSIQYCYEARNRGVGDTAIFNLLSLHRETGGVFRVANSIPIRSTPSHEICVHMSGTGWCCDNTPLSSNQLSIPSSGYTFGVVTFGGDDTTTPLAFHNSVGNFQVPRIDVAAGVPAVPSTITTGPPQPRSLLLLRFLIGTGILNIAMVYYCLMIIYYRH